MKQRNVTDRCRRWTEYELYRYRYLFRSARLENSIKRSVIEHDTSVAISNSAICTRIWTWWPVSFEMTGDSMCLDPVRYIKRARRRNSGSTVTWLTKVSFGRRSIKEKNDHHASIELLRDGKIFKYTQIFTYEKFSTLGYLGIGKYEMFESFENLKIWEIEQWIK